MFECSHMFLYVLIYVLICTSSVSVIRICRDFCLSCFLCCLSFSPCLSGDVFCFPFLNIGLGAFVRHVCFAIIVCLSVFGVCSLLRLLFYLRLWSYLAVLLSSLWCLVVGWSPSGRPEPQLKEYDTLVPVDGYIELFENLYDGVVNVCIERCQVVCRCTSYLIWTNRG